MRTFKGFGCQLTEKEKDIIKCFNEYGEFHLLEYALKEKVSSSETSELIHSLLRKNVITRCEKLNVFKLTKKGLKLL